MTLVIDNKGRTIPSDLTIQVRRESTTGGRLRFKYSLTLSNRSFYECESNEISDFEGFLYKKFNRINAVMADPSRRNRINEELKTIGKELYKALFGPKFDTIYWDVIRNNVETIQIVSDENIPWELVYPVDLGSKNGIPGTEFLCQRHNIANWFTGRMAALESVDFRHVRITNAIKDENSLMEKKNIELTCLDHGIPMEFFKPTCNEVSTRMCSESDSILHVICHGSNNGDLPTISLDGNSKLSPDDIKNNSQEFRRNSLVFLNGCETGILGTGLSCDTVGWPPTLVREANVNVVLGTILKIPGGSACDFSTTFYKELFSGRSVTESTKQARRKVEEYVGLSYKVYGNPLAKLHFIPYSDSVSDEVSSG
jgi:CHAT domain